MTISYEAERLARSITEQFELGLPPVDVEYLAGLLGVDQIVEALLVEDGRMERLGGSTRIVIRSSLAQQRRRFTIAHELCHVLLADPNSDLMAARHIIGHDQEERFCEDFAAALLLPWAWVKAIAYNRPQSLHTLRVVAGRSNASLASVCVRLNKVAGWQRTLLHWKHHNDRWIFRWAAGLPAGLEGRIRSAKRTPDLFRALDERGDVEASVPIMIGGEEREIPALVSVRHGSSLVLAQLT